MLLPTVLHIFKQIQIPTTNSSSWRVAPLQCFSKIIRTCGALEKTRVLNVPQIPFTFSHCCNSSKKFVSHCCTQLRKSASERSAQMIPKKLIQKASHCKKNKLAEKKRQTFHSRRHVRSHVSAVSGCWRRIPCGSSLAMYFGDSDERNCCYRAAVLVSMSLSLCSSSSKFVSVCLSRCLRL